MTENSKRVVQEEVAESKGDEREENFLQSLESSRMKKQRG